MIKMRGKRRDESKEVERRFLGDFGGFEVM
jgi:hypothetical protein